MRQLVLVLLGGAFVVLSTAAPAPEVGAEFPVPCGDDGLAHIPDLPEGVRRPYSVRKRSRTVHHDSVSDDTPQLPPGQRRFDAVLPDEQGQDTTSTASTARSQRRLGLDVNEVAADQPGQQQQGPRRAARRPRPRKLSEDNYPVNDPVLSEHDAKSDAVVDSYEKVRRYPTHLPAEDIDDDNLTDNDVLDRDVPANDQVALEDVPTASTEQRVDDNGSPAIDADPDVPPGFRSKFPKRTFASDAGGSGDVLRLKPRKHVNQYQPPQHAEDHVEEVPATTATPQQQRRPRPRPQQAEQVQPEEEQPRPDQDHGGAPVAGRQRVRASHRVRADGGAPQRQQARRRPEYATVPPVPEAGVDAPDASDASQQPQAPRQLRRRPYPRPRPSPVTDEEHQDSEEQQQPERQQQQRQQRPLRRRPRPRPSTTPEPTAVDQTDAATIPEQDNAVQENAVSPSPSQQPSFDGQPQRRPLRRRLRPRPTTPATVEEGEVQEVQQELDNAVSRPQPQQRRRRPQPGAASRTSSRTVVEESFQTEQSVRGRGRKLSSGNAVQNLPQVEVEHDGTALEKKEDGQGHGQGQEPTLVRSAVKKVPAGGHAGDPSPALIQKIVKNTLRRLQPQIAEHEGDVGVDILVKIIQVEDRK